MTSWRKLLTTGSTRFLLLLSGLLQLIAIIVGGVVLSGAGQAQASAVYFGVDLPPLLYLFSYRAYWPDCDSAFGRDAIAHAMTISGHIANLGYVLWLVLLPIYFWRVLNFRAPRERVFQHPDDRIGLPQPPRTGLRNVVPYPSRRTLFYAAALLLVVELFRRLILSGVLSNEICASLGASMATSLLVPSVQVVGFLVVEWTFFEVIAALYSAPYSDLAR